MWNNLQFVNLLIAFKRREIRNSFFHDKFQMILMLKNNKWKFSALQCDQFIMKFYVIEEFAFCCDQIFRSFSLNLRFASTRMIFNQNEAKSTSKSHWKVHIFIDRMETNAFSFFDCLSITVVARVFRCYFACYLKSKVKIFTHFSCWLR